MPDTGFVQLRVRDVPALELSTEAGVIRTIGKVVDAGQPTGYGIRQIFDHMLP